MRPADGVPVLVFDLDETVLSINSFPRWVLFLIIGALPDIDFRRRVLLSLRVQFLLLRRKIGGIDHGRLLQELQAVWQAAATDRGETMARRFRVILIQYVRPNLRRLLATVAAKRVDAILATAALSDYAAEFGRELGFRHVLTTPAGNDSTRFVNSGVRKRDRVLGFLHERGWAGRPLILFTDHLDDMPLIRESSIVCWFGSPEVLAIADATAPGTRLVFCRDLSHADRRRLSDAGRPGGGPRAGDHRVVDRQQHYSVAAGVRWCLPIPAVRSGAGGAHHRILLCQTHAMHQALDIATAEYPTVDSIDHSLRGAVASLTIAGTPRAAASDHDHQIVVGNVHGRRARYVDDIG